MDAIETHIQVLHQSVMEYVSTVEQPVAVLQGLSTLIQNAVTQHRSIDRINNGGPVDTDSSRRVVIDTTTSVGHRTARFGPERRGRVGRPRRETKGLSRLVKNIASNGDVVSGGPSSPAAELLRKVDNNMQLFNKYFMRTPLATLVESLIANAAANFVVQLVLHFESAPLEKHISSTLALHALVNAFPEDHSQDTYAEGLPPVTKRKLKRAFRTANRLKDIESVQGGASFLFAPLLHDLRKLSDASFTQLKQLLEKSRPVPAGAVIALQAFLYEMQFIPFTIQLGPRQTISHVFPNPCSGDASFRENEQPLLHPSFHDTGFIENEQFWTNNNSVQNLAQQPMPTHLSSQLGGYTSVSVGNDSYCFPSVITSY